MGPDEETLMPDPDPVVQKKTADQRMADLAPEYFAELMTQFVQKTELSARQKIRRKIKGLLDIFSADTVWPQGHPDLGARPARRGQFEGAGVQQGFGGLAIAPDQGARAHVADDLAEPPAVGALPAPGAGLAGDLQMRA